MTAGAGSVDGALLAPEARPLGWLRTAPVRSRRALAAAALGWMFDGFDIMVYSLVLTAVVADFGISRAAGGGLGSLTLAASAAGGWFFGRVADRHGRRAGLISSVLTYSMFTAACGLAQTVWQLAIFRALLEESRNLMPEQVIDAHFKGCLRAARRGGADVCQRRLA